MPIPPTFEMDSPNWLRRLRWGAIAVMIAVYLCAYLLGVEFGTRSVLLLICGLGIWNLLLPLIEEPFPFGPRTFVFLQMIVDVVVFTAILWFSGGLVNPFAAFFLLHIMIGGLLLTSMLTAIISVLASLAIFLLAFAPGVGFEGHWYELKHTGIWFGRPIALILLILFTNAFILVFLARLRRAQEQLRQRRKMEALGRLVAGLAHEIGTPLNSILVLAKDLEGAVPQEFRKEINTIAGQAQRCGEIVSLLLGYSRTLVRSGQDVKYVPVRLVPWIEECFQLLVQATKKEMPQFQLDVVDLPDKVEIPELIVRQVLQNLLRNALDAVENVRHPKIRVRLYADPYEREMVLIVEDNGPGFSKEAREQAFDAFFTTKKQGVGTGLGLYISYYLLSQVGGRIVVEDNSGPGAKILVAFPWPQERTKHDFQRDDRR